MGLSQFTIAFVHACGNTTPLFTSLHFLCYYLSFYDLSLDGALVPEVWLGCAWSMVPVTIWTACRAVILSSDLLCVELLLWSLQCIWTACRTPLFTSLHLLCVASNMWCVFPSNPSCVARTLVCSRQPCLAWCPTPMFTTEASSNALVLRRGVKCIKNLIS